MTAANYDECLRRVLSDEGGYSNDAGDPGGPTKYGITIIDYRKYVKPNASAADVRAMTVAEAKTIYAQRYWGVTKGDAEAAGLDYAMFDYGVNSGVARAGKVLRRLCDMPTTDWHVTPEVLAAVSRRNPLALSNAIWDERLRFLQSLSTWHLFGAGWGSRVRRGKLASQKMAGADVTTAATGPVGKNGKGVHPDPTTTKAVITAGGAGAVSAGTLFHWIGAHLLISGMVGLAVIGGVAYLVWRINAAHHARQTEPMAGTMPVPVAT